MYRLLLLCLVVALACPAAGSDTGDLLSPSAPTDILAKPAPHPASGDGDGRVGGSPEALGGGQHEGGAESLPTREKAVAHRFGEGGRIAVGGEEGPVEVLLDAARRFGEIAGNVHRLPWPLGDL